MIVSDRVDDVLIDENGFVDARCCAFGVILLHQVSICGCLVLPCSLEELILFGGFDGGSFGVVAIGVLGVIALFGRGLSCDGLVERRDRVVARLDGGGVCLSQQAFQYGDLVAGGRW